MFSERTRWDLTTNRLSEAVSRARRARRPLIDLTESNPTAAGLQPGPEVLALLADPAGARYAPDPRGLLSAREAVARDYERRGVAVPPDHRATEVGEIVVDRILTGHSASRTLRYRYTRLDSFRC